MIAFLQSIAGTSRARVIVSNGNAFTPAGVSTRTSSPSVPRKVPLMRFAPSTGARQRELRFLSGEARVIGQFLDGTIEPRRRNLEPFEIDILHREEPRQVIRYPRAILDVDAARLVDEYADEPAPRRHVPVDELVPQCRYRTLQKITQAQRRPRAHCKPKKNGLRPAHFSFVIRAGL